MVGQIGHALTEAAKKTEQALARDLSKAYGGILKETERNGKRVADQVAENERKIAGDLARGGTGHGGEGGGPKPPSGPGKGESREPDLNKGKAGGGQGTEGNGKLQTGGDPVDVVSGQMVMTATDLELPGLLPLVLRRAYASGYQAGTLFGPGWSSTLTQRLQIDHLGIHYAGDDGQILHYPAPAQGQKAYPEDGARWPLTWDRTEDTICIEDPQTGWTRHFPPVLPVAEGGPARSSRPLAAITDRNGNWIEFLYDAERLPVEVRRSGGRPIAVDTGYTAGGWRIEELRLLDDSRGGLGTTVMVFGYDGTGRLQQVANSSEVPLVYQHDEYDRVTSWTDRNGHWYAYEYGRDGRVSAGRGSLGALDADFGYDLANRVTTMTNSQGESTEFHYDEHKHLTRIVDPLGHTTRTQHDRYGRLLVYTDPLGHTTRLTLDSRDDVVRVDSPDGTNLRFTYNRLHQPTEIRTPDGLTWSQTFDERGNRTAVTDRSGVTTRFGYTEHGHLAAVTDALGNTSTAECDRGGLLVAATDALGGRTEFERDAFGRPVTITDELGQRTRFTWTVEGRALTRQDHTGATEAWAYDPEGNMVRHTDATGAVTELEYTHFNLPAARTAADGARYTFTHDTELRLTQVAQPQGLTWDYTYDAAGRLTGESDFEGHALHYAYDPAGHLTERRNGLGQRIAYRLDAKGRVVAKETDGQVTEYGYDEAGRLLSARAPGSELSRSYDPLGRVLSETVDGRTITYAYDVRGQMTGRRTPSGGTSHWTYDQLGHPRTLTAAGHLVTFDHDAAGREVSRALAPDLTLALTWDPENRLTGQTLSGSAGLPLIRRTYRYRADGELTALTEQTGANPARTTSFQQDRVGRVTAVRAADWTETYAYDQGGHLVGATWPGAAAAAAGGERTFDGSLVSSAGRVTYQYDAQGRTTARHLRTLSGRTRVWRYTWDAENQLTAVTTPEGDRWHYRYDPLGRRITKQHFVADGEAWTLHEWTDFSWDGHTLAEQTAHGPHLPGPYTLTWDHRGLHPVAQTEHLVTQDETDRRFFAIVTDLVGTPTHLLAPDGTTAWEQRSTIWGLPVATGQHATTTPLRFPGQYHDPESRLHYNVFRYYDPATARYLSADPLGLSPAPDAYTYVGNPLLACDPLGLAARHDRKSEYPKGYWQDTHDEMVKNWTHEGVGAGTGDIRDANGKRVPRSQLHWFDAQGNNIPPGQQTYEHTRAVVDHYNTVGHNSDRATRDEFFNNTSHMEAMSRQQNSSGGGSMTQTYTQNTGPNYQSR
ncbi:DUF6531 domain-containing protein [Kitasatospora sp. NPDC049258]|uniref:DUF6531 domain-containing protein n=1 Tax=Kitasatospora sp. NPDC049258 TaxID=3155394 RepID=UPI0034475595